MFQIRERIVLHLCCLLFLSFNIQAKKTRPLKSNVIKLKNHTFEFGSFSMFIWHFAIKLSVAQQVRYKFYFPFITNHIFFFNCKRKLHNFPKNKHGK